MSQRRPVASPPVGARNSLQAILGIGARFKRQAAIGCGACRTVWVIQEQDTVLKRGERTIEEDSSVSVKLAPGRTLQVNANDVFAKEQFDDAMRRVTRATMQRTATVSERYNNGDRVFVNHNGKTREGTIEGTMNHSKHWFYDAEGVYSVTLVPSWMVQLSKGKLIQFFATDVYNTEYEAARQTMSTHGPLSGEDEDGDSESDNESKSSSSSACCDKRLLFLVTYELRLNAGEGCGAEGQASLDGMFVHAGTNEQAKQIAIDKARSKGKYWDDAYMEAFDCAYMEATDDTFELMAVSTGP